MGTITLKNVRTTSDVTMNTSLKDGGVYIDWSELADIKAWLWSDAQKTLAGRCDVRVDTDDPTNLICEYASTKAQYPGINRLVVQATYMGETKTYDKPAFNFVRWTAGQTGEQVTLDDPDVDVAIEVTDVSSSILQRAISAALAAAAHAEHAASLVPLQVLQDCEQATIEANQARDDADAAAEHATPYIGENGHWWRWSKETGAYVDTGEVAQGPTGNGIQSVEQTQTSEESEGENVVTVTMTDGTQAQFVIRNGKQGEQGIQGQPGVANAKYKQVETLPEASAETLDFIYLTPGQTASVFNMSYTEQDGNTYTWKPLGTTAIQLADYATEAEVSLLRQKVSGVGQPIVPTWQREGYYVANDGTVTASADWSVSDPILLKKNHTIIVKMKSGAGAAVVASTDENGTTYTQLVPTNGYHGNSVTSVYRYTAKQDEYIAVSVKVANDYTVEEAVDGLEKEADMSVKAIGDVTDSPNKFDRFSIVRGGMYAVNASWINNATFYSSDFIPVMPGDTVKILFKPVAFSVNGNWTAFKSDKVTSAGGGQANINQSGGSYEFTVPSAWADTRYIAIGFFFEIDPSTIVVTVNGNTAFKIPQTAVEGLETALNGKQNTLNAGDNITIQNNVISTKTGVLVNESQTLTETQKETARENIDAASEGEITYVNTEDVNATIGFANWAYGYIKPNGTIQQASSGSWRYSDKIPIVPDTPIVVNKMYCNTAVTSVASYDENDNFIAECSLSQSTNISESNPVTIQTTGKNVAYIRITIGGGYPSYNVMVTQYSGVKTIKEVIAEVQEQIEGIEEELGGISVGTQWSGKSWVALGTSITDTKNTLAPDGTTTGKFLPYLAALSGLVVTDKGVAGSVIGGHILYYAGHTTETATADIITIEGGVNDWAGNRPLGQVGDTVPYLVEWSSPVWNNGGSADGTFAGACYQAIKTAMENSPKALVVVITDNTGQYIASTGAHCEREHQNSLGLRQKDYTDMLIAVARYMGVPVINAGQKSMINQDNPEYLIDQIHQTELGGEQFANVIWSELKMMPLRVTE